MERLNVVSDACCVINLLATRRAAEIIDALGWTLIMSNSTRLETKYLDELPDEQGRRERVPIDTAELEAAAQIRVVPVDGTWTDAFVACAEHLTDADASAVALAGTLGTPLLSDDPKVRRVARELFESIDLRSTLGVLRDATARMRLASHDLKRVARDLRWRGRFLPPNGDRDREWFRALLSR